MFDMFENEHFSDNICKGDGKMILNDRQNELLKLLKQHGRMSVKKLAEHFYVSEMTVRRDLKEMENCGYLQRYNGGAVYMRENALLPFDLRKFTHLKEKKQIIENAKKYLADSLTVFIDSSSTCLYIIPALAEYKDIKLVTNSVQSLMAAAEYHIPCIISGGMFYESDMCCVGSLAEEFLRNINVDIAFFSASAISDDGVISDTDISQTAVRKIIMQNSDKNIFFLDKEKCGKKHMYTLCRKEKADDVIIL